MAGMWSGIRQAIEKSYLQGDPSATLRAAAWIQHDVAQRLFKLAGLGDLDQAIDDAGKPGASIPLNFRSGSTRHIESRVRRYVSAQCRGPRPRRKLRPIRPSSTPRTTIIWASTPTPKATTSTTAPPTTAPAAASSWSWPAPLRSPPVRPPHAVYFAAVTAEEQGLLGSQYLGMHPPVPAGQIALDLNYDMLLPIGIPALGKPGRSGAHRLLAHRADPLPRHSIWLCCPIPRPWPATTTAPTISRWPASAFPPFPSIRAISLKATRRTGATQQAEDYVAHHYHQPSDEYRADWDFRGNAKLARFGFVLGWLASDQAKPVEWLPGDEFEAPRKASR